MYWYIIENSRHSFRVSLATHLYGKDYSVLILMQKFFLTLWDLSAAYVYSQLVNESLCLCILYQSYLTITAGTEYIWGDWCPSLICISLWETGIFNVPGDGSPSTRDLHLKHDPNCLSARPPPGRAITHLFGWYGRPLWHHLVNVVDLVHLSVSVAWLQCGADHSRVSPAS